MHTSQQIKSICYGILDFICWGNKVLEGGLYLTTTFISVDTTSPGYKTQNEEHQRSLRLYLSILRSLNPECKLS